MREVRSFPVICKYRSKKTRRFLSESFYFLCKRIHACSFESGGVLSDSYC